MPGANGVLHGGLYAGGVAAPRHQRLMSESVVEVKSLQRLAAEQGREIAELRKSHDDLELRLEVQSNRCMDLERTLEDQEREWAEQAQELEEERDGWKTRFEKEEEKNQHLRMQMGRKDQDIQRMLQRKVSLVLLVFIRSFVRLSRDTRYFVFFPLQEHRPFLFVCLIRRILMVSFVPTQCSAFGLSRRVLQLTLLLLLLLLLVFIVTVCVSICSTVRQTR